MSKTIRRASVYFQVIHTPAEGDDGAFYTVSLHKRGLPGRDAHPFDYVVVDDDGQLEWRETCERAMAYMRRFYSLADSTPVHLISDN